MATLTDAQLADLREKAKVAQSNRAALDVVRALNPKVADWLAAADPQTILALLQRIGDLEAELAIERSAVEVLATRAKSILGTVCQEGWRRCPLLRQDHQCGGALACGSIKGCNAYFADYARGEARKRLGLGEEVTPDGQ